MHVDTHAVDIADPGRINAGNTVAALLLSGPEDNRIAHGNRQAIGQDLSDQQPLRCAAKILEAAAAAGDLGREVGNGKVIFEPYTHHLGRVVLEGTVRDHGTLDHRGNAGHVLKFPQRLDHRVGLLHPLDVFARLPRGFDLEEAFREVAGGVDVENCVLEPVFDPDCAVGPENRPDEEFLKAARLRLSDDEKAHAEDDAGEAHQHRTALGRQKAEGDAEVGGQSRKEKTEAGDENETARQRQGMAAESVDFTDVRFSGPPPARLVLDDLGPHPFTRAEFVLLLHNDGFAGRNALENFDVVEAVVALLDLADFHASAAHDDVDMVADQGATRNSHGVRTLGDNDAHLAGQTGHHLASLGQGHVEKHTVAL